MRLTWVRNYSEKYNKATSLWHLLHSMRAEETGYARRVDGFALTYCGQRFYNPRSRYNLPKTSWRKPVCDGCDSVFNALSKTAEIQDELVIREDA
jgi:hypothetical protein